MQSTNSFGRTLLLSTLAFVASFCSVQGQEPAKTLRDASKGFFEVGVALPDRVVRDERLNKIAALQFNRVVCENEMKFESLEPQENRFTFERGDRLVEFAQKNGMSVHGHTLVWHAQTPRWVFQDANGGQASKELVMKRLKNHIDTVMKHYKGKIKTWDVVNEAFTDQGNLRTSSPWYRALGNDLIKIAFTLAREADPDAILIYNDYSMPNDPKRQGIIKAIKEINKEKKIIDGIGYQGHWDLNWPSLAQIQKAIDEAREAGLKLYISELDINTDRSKRNSGRGLEANPEIDPSTLQPITDMNVVLRDRYREIFEIFLKNADVIEAVTVWGLDDAHSWIRGEPLLYDRNQNPKPALQAIIDLMNKTPKTQK